MQKVIALNEKEERVLTTRTTAEKHNWWITHNLTVTILPVTSQTPRTSTEPDEGNIMESKGRFYRIIESEKILICSICKEPAKFKIDKRFYCKKHYKHLMLTRPIRRGIILPNRNDTCTCGSGKKYKNCCLKNYEHTPRHYFNSRYMENRDNMKSQTL
jgi:hypothetical protein